mmetsp:Transcript_20869/g.47195  ORF Transcript_20869/g.47195 Transcript_20869/m.47195 type:complete len:756 (+) Transcript_20869:373-2640(+)
MRNNMQPRLLAGDDTSTYTDDWYDENYDQTVDYQQIVSASIAAAVAWNVLVITLEVNDFRHRLKSVFIAIDESADRTQRYVASLVAIRLGLRDALIDWALLYAVGYSFVAGFTYHDADPNSVYVIWGVSIMVSAGMTGTMALKVPQWLGSYRKSQLQVLQDTSAMALEASTSVMMEESSLKDFRYSVRLGVSTHLSQFVIFLLPFYVNLHVQFFLLSIVVALVVGNLYLYVVFKLNRRYVKRKRRIAVGAATFFTLVSSLLFAYGLYTIDFVWGWSFNSSQLKIWLVAFFSWLGVMLFLQGLQYWEQGQIRKLEDDNEELMAQLFDRTERGSDHESERDNDHNSPCGAQESIAAAVQGESITASSNDRSFATSALEEPLLSPVLTSRRTISVQSVNDDSYLYSSVYFDRVKILSAEKHENIEHSTLLRNSAHETAGEGSATVFDSVLLLENNDPKQMYQSILDKETPLESPKWYRRVYDASPIGPALYCAKLHFGCCKKSGRGESSDTIKTCVHQFWYIIIKILVVAINLLALYVAVVACGATWQIKRTIRKLPYVDQTIYAHMNEGPVCAFDEKCGNIDIYPNETVADLTNHTIAHCGPCGKCSGWSDLELQYSTRHDLAERAQACATKEMFKGKEALQQCLVNDIGWTWKCAGCWADSIKCSSQHCIFIYLQSLWINAAGDFDVSPDQITSATCSEANCEAGNPGDFVACSGANRRRMNITSDIARPGTQQCAIVGIPDNDWGAFFDPPCPSE